MVDLVQNEDVRSGSNCISRYGMRLSFGLGQASRVENIEAPQRAGGAGTFGPVETNCRVPVWQGDGARARLWLCGFGRSDG